MAAYAISGALRSCVALSPLILFILGLLGHVRAEDGVWKKTFPPWDENTTRPRLQIPIILDLTGQDCGPSDYMSMRVAISHINQRDSYLAPLIGNITNDFQLEYTVVDAQGMDLPSIKATVDLGIVEGSRKVVVGPATSSATFAANPMVKAYQVPQLGWVSTSVLLSAEGIFPNFFRLTSADSVRFTALQTFLTSMDLDHIYLVTVLDTMNGIRQDEFFVHLSGSRALDQQTRRLVVSGSLHVGAVDHTGYVKTNTHIEAIDEALLSFRLGMFRIVVVLANAGSTYVILQRAALQGMTAANYMWLGFDGVQHAIQDWEEIPQVFHGMVQFTYTAPGDSSERLYDLWAEHMPSTETPELDALPGYCDSELPCANFSSFIGWTHGREDSSLSCRVNAANAYDSMVVLAYIADTLLTEKGITEPSELTNIDWMDGLKAFTERGAHESKSRLGLSGEMNWIASGRHMEVHVMNWRAISDLPVFVAKFDLQKDAAFVWQVGEEMYWPGIAYGIAIVDESSFPLPENISVGRPSDCESGYVHNTTVGYCTRCPAGTTPQGSTRGSVIRSSCTSCPAGRVALQPASSECVMCSAGYIADSQGTACIACPAGTTSSSNGETCETCPEGTYSDAEGSTCSQCPVGTAPSNSSDACDACSPGTYSEFPGAAACDPCDLGQITEESGLNRCRHCLEGTYADVEGLSECRSCELVLAGSTTKLLGATSAEECLCPADYYRNGNTSTTCLPCPTGFTCAAGSDVANFQASRTSTQLEPWAYEPFTYPELEDGYYSDWGDPMKAYLCGVYLACPGGSPGSCNGGLTGLTCSRCPAGTYFEDVACHTCSPMDGQWQLAALTAVMFVVGTLVHISMNRRTLSSSRITLFLAVLTSMTINSAYTVSVFATMHLSWPSMLSSFLSFFTRFDFDVENLHLDCMLLNSSFLSKYVRKVLVWPGCMMLIFVGSFLCSMHPKVKPFSAFRAPALQNSTGGLMSLTFVPLGMLSLVGFRCIRMPFGGWVLQADTSIACWENAANFGDTHGPILAWSILSLCCFPISFLTITFVCTFWYGSLSSRYGTNFTSRVRFLTDRMHPEKVLFSFALNVRNFLVALIPTVFANEYQDKVLWSGLVFLTWLIVQTHWQCWRFPLLNCLDCIVSAAIIALLSQMALLAARDEALDEVRLCHTIITMVVCMVSITILGMLYRAILFAFRRKKYSVFISHHKAAAAVYARHVKILLEEYSCSNNGVPFLDVDELDNLENLSYAVSCSQRFLLLLTDRVFSRPWCAIEIAAAHQRKVPMIVAQLNDDRALCDTHSLRAVIEAFGPTDRMVFSQNGVSQEQLEQAYLFVGALVPCRLPLNDAGSTRIQACLQFILSKDFTNNSRNDKQDASLCASIIFDSNDDVDCSIAQVCSTLLRRRDVDTIICNSEAVRRNIRGDESMLHVGLVLISKGLTADPYALGSITMMQREKQSFVTFTSSEGFVHPDALWFLRMARGELICEKNMGIIRKIAPGAMTEEIAEALKPIFRILAWEFKIEQNWLLVQEQFKVLVHRLTRAGVSSPTSQCRPEGSLHRRPSYRLVTEAWTAVWSNRATRATCSCLEAGTGSVSVSLATELAGESVRGEDDNDAVEVVADPLLKANAPKRSVSEFSSLLDTSDVLGSDPAQPATDETEQILDVSSKNPLPPIISVGGLDEGLRKESL